MSANGEQERTRLALATAISNNLLPEDVRDQASSLLSHLETPIRVSVLGLPQSGKSTLIGLLLGQQIAPAGIKLPTMEVKSAPSAQAILTLQDGSTKTLQDIDWEKISSFDPVFIQLGFNLPSLNKISVMELVTSDDRLEQIRAMRWAAKRTDIAIWATQSYYGTEHGLWRDMPDLIKDHSFLIRTKADELGGVAERQNAIDDLRQIAGDHFAKVLPLATLEATAARHADGSTDKDLLRSSGGIGLISSIMRQIESGRQSTIDQAAVLLYKNDLLDAEGNIKAPLAANTEPVTPTEPSPPIESASVAEPTASDPSVGEPDQLVAQSDVVETAFQNAVSQDLLEDVAAISAPEATVKEGVRAEIAPIDNSGALGQSTRIVFENTAIRLGELGSALLSNDNLNPAAIIGAAEKELDALSSALDDLHDDDGPQIVQMRDSTLDAQDMVQLMKLERDTNAAMDAMSILVQVRRQLLLNLR